MDEVRTVEDIVARLEREYHAARARIGVAA